ncbi:MAG: hypothetical protein Q9196_002580 [Gyalolechia fulgens]
MEGVGLAPGMASLAGVFRSCVDCFGYIRLGRNFGEDYGICVLRVDVAKVRLTRWGSSIGFSQHSLAIPPIDASNSELETAHRLLKKILEAFEKARETSKDYEANAGASEDLNLYDDTTSLTSEFSRLRTIFHNSAATYKKKSEYVSGAAAWGIYRKRLFDRLLEDITELVDQLVTVFPGAIAGQQALATEQAARIEDAEDLKLLYELAKTEDVLLEKVVQQEMTLRGSTYNKLEAKNKSKMHAGDVIGLGVKGRSHIYNGGGTSDDAHGHFGNIYRG